MGSFLKSGCFCEIMGLWSAVKATLRSRRFWVWQIAGVIIYGLPAAYRFATGSVAIPILNFPGVCFADSDNVSFAKGLEQAAANNLKPPIIDLSKYDSEMLVKYYEKILIG